MSSRGLPKNDKRYSTLSRFKKKKKSIFKIPVEYVLSEEALLVVSIRKYVEVGDCRSFRDTTPSVDLREMENTLQIFSIKIFND